MGRNSSQIKKDDNYLIIKISENEKKLIVCLFLEGELHN